MAELPGWKPSISTSMPMKTPQLRPNPAMVQPRVQQFRPLNNPNDYLRLASAEANKYGAIGKAVTSAVDVGVQIIDASEEAEAKTVVAQYSEDLANYSAMLMSDESLYTEQENADGTTTRVYSHETAEERFNLYAKDYQDRIKSDRNFSTRKAQSIVSVGFSTNDEQFRSKVQKYVRDARIDKGRADLIDRVEIFKKTMNMQGLEDAYAEGVQSKLYEPKAWRSYIDGAKQDATYGNYVQLAGELELLVDKGQITQGDYETVEYAYRTTILDPDTNLSGEQRRKLDNIFDDLDETFEERQEEAQERNTTDFIIQYTTQPERRGEILANYKVTDAKDMRDRFGDKGARIAIKLLEAEATVGTPSRDKREAYSIQLRDYAAGTSELTRSDLELLLTGLDLDAATYGTFHTQLMSVVEKRQNKALNNVKDVLATNLSTDGFSYKTLYRLVQNQQASRADIKAMGDVDRLVAKYEDEILAAPNRDWGSFMVKEVSRNQSFPIMLSASGMPTSDPQQMDIPSTVNHLDSLDVNYRSFLNDRKSELEDVGMYDLTPDRPGYAARKKLWIDYARDIGITQGPYMIDQLFPQQGNVLKLKRQIERYQGVQDAMRRMNNE